MPHADFWYFDSPLLTISLQPVTAAILAWRLFGETLTLQQGLVGVIVLAGDVLARWSDRKPVS